ncbi:YbaB/EbfC family nucleoid-associated protein [Nonomuraea sp. NPDC050536]|uniref:YbaB/EbfC family nucleoid-associated protein n=1 Tax=Nonomuraea sp. NPDC050536 TaxID=3364366 RepID=UPI0037C9D524
MDELVDEWSERHFTGQGDRGGVVANVDAVGNLLALEISAMSKRRLDGPALGDAVVAAVRAAEEAASEAQAVMLRGLHPGLAEAQQAFEARSRRSGR